MFAQFRRSLRVRIAAGVLGGVFVTLWLTYVTLDYFLRREMEATLSAQQFSVVSLLADDIDRSVRERLQALEAVAEVLQQAGRGASGTRSDVLRQQPALLSLFNWGVLVTDREGTALVSLPESMGRQGVNYGEVESIRLAVSEGRAQIGRAVFGKTTGKPVIPMVVPVRDRDGRISGTLIGLTNLAAANFLDDISSNRFGRRGGYLITDPEQRIFIAATDKTRVMQAGPPVGVNPVFDRYLEGYDGSGVARSSRGVVELSSSKRVPSTGWLMQAVLPTEEAFAPIDEVLQRIVVASVAVGLLAAGLVLWWLRHELRPLGEAASMLGQMRDGLIPRQPLPVRRDDETGALAGAFNGLLAAIVAEEARAAEHLFNQRLRAIVSRVPGIVIQYQRYDDGRYTLPFASDALREICGLEASAVEHSADDFHALLHADDAEAFFASRDRSAEALEPWHCEFRIRHPEAGVRWLLLDAMPEPDAAGLSWHGFVTDITGLKEIESELRIAAATFETQEGIFITDAEKRIVRVNQAFTAMTGYSVEEAVGQRPSLLRSGLHSADFYRHLHESLAKDGFWQGEIWNRRKNGEIYAEWVTISAVQDTAGRVTNYVAAFSDITEHKKSEEQIHRLAFYDPLTQLPNRRLFYDRLEQAAVASARAGYGCALLFLDMDGFKSLNDRYGHALGDELLVTVAQRLSVCVRESDTVARLGGDEFVVILEHLGDEPAAAAQAEMVAQKIREALVAPYELRGRNGDTHVTFNCSASIGVSLFRGHELSREDIIKRADIAMYEAKAGGRNTIRFYTPACEVAAGLKAAAG